jgi:transcriptional regulator with XRE-family HTH domain
MFLIMNYKAGVIQIAALEGFRARVRETMTRHSLRFDADLARASGLNRSTLANMWKKGRKALPYADQAVAIAKALDTTVEYLVTGLNGTEERRDPEVDAWLELARGRSKEELAELRGVVRSYVEQHFTRGGQTATGS